MDSRSLADERVIDASRSFVCIRLATYEDAAEAKFLKSIYQSRSGELENTTFAVLTPDGRKKLTRSGRSPDHIFGSPARMARELGKIASSYKTDSSRGLRETERALPYMKDVELALNVAAAEQLPVAVVYSVSDEDRVKLEQKLVPLASMEPLMGQFVFAKTTDEQDLKPFGSSPGKSAIILVHPGKYGLTGKTIGVFDSDVDAQKLAREMEQVAMNMPKIEKDHHSHVRAGIRLGLEWESEVPESDPQSVRARKNVRGER